MYMRSIYLVLTQTGSVLSSAIKIATGKKYNHVSLSFDDSLHEMYSFGRKYPYNPFIGVFVVESINKGTYLRFKNTSCMVIEIPISDEKFDRLYSNVMDMVYNKDKYKYNVKGLFLAKFDIYAKYENRFYCSEFVRYVFDISGIDVSMIPNIVHPMDFLNMDYNLVYEGLLKDYESEKMRENVLQKVSQ